MKFNLLEAVVALIVVTSYELVGKGLTNSVVEVATNDDIDKADKRKGKETIDDAVELDENFIASSHITSILFQHTIRDLMFILLQCCYYVYSNKTN